MRQYAINLRDGRVVLCTRETLANIDYYAISEKVATAIESGKLDRKLVISKIKGKLLTNEKEWDALLMQKTTQNVRHSDINTETTEQSETKIEKEEVSAEFDMPIPGEGGTKAGAKKGAGKGGNKGTSGTKTEEVDADGDCEGAGADGDGDGYGEPDLSGM